MYIDIQAHGIPLTDALRDHTQRRLGFSLARAADRVRRVKVRLSDVNGPRGGIDKRCRIQVTLNGLGEVVIEDTEADPFLAIGRAAERIGRNILRRLKHRNTHGRSTPRSSRNADMSLIQQS
ncbi:MAG: HPF/RaiA family ribosome-associated protein [Proteobacteria bacterium]|jgi:ribosomal subunit interface protein|nr:HPF/RaiA family ribosome-associated protein [Pseudomonadota bacterium]